MGMLRTLDNFVTSFPLDSELDSRTANMLKHHEKCSPCDTSCLISGRLPVRFKIHGLMYWDVHTKT